MTDRRRARLTRLALVALLPAVAMSASCFRVGTLPAREMYRLALPDSLAPNAPAAPADAAPLAGTLAVATWRAPGLYGAPGIVYRVDDTQYGTYPAREWAIPLGDQLGVFTNALLRRAPLTRGGALHDPPNPRALAYIWRGTIREFEEVDRGREVFAAVRLEALLVRAADDSVLWQGAVRLERPVADPTMANIVAELSSLAIDAIARLTADAAAAVVPPRVTGATPARP